MSDHLGDLLRNPDVGLQHRFHRASGEDWRCGASRDLPISEDGGSWDGAAALKSMLAKDAATARRGCGAFDAAGSLQLQQSYKLPFARFENGQLTAIPAGLRAAAARVHQADIPDDVASDFLAVFDAYRKKDGMRTGDGEEDNGENGEPDDDDMMPGMPMPGRGGRFRSLGDQIQAIWKYYNPEIRQRDPRLVRAPTGASIVEPQYGGFLIAPEFANELLVGAYEQARVAPLCTRLPVTCGVNWRRKRGQRFASRRRRAGSCRSTLASAG
jgi:hypothetical protein